MAAPLEMDYTNRDYDSILTFLVSAAKGFFPEWVTVGEPADFGTLLLELYAYLGDILNFYIDRCAAEPFLVTAQRRQSVLGIAQMLGYTPVAQSSASGVVTFTLDPNAYQNSSLTIPAGTIVQTPQAENTPAIFFETTGNSYLGYDIRTVDQGVNEGRTVDTEFLSLSNGAPMQEYVLMYAGVIYRSLRVFVEETDQATIEWSYVDNLTFSNPDAAVYTTYLDDQQFTHVVFGDNVAGRIPPNGSQITCSYRYGMGSLGNVVGGTITMITPPIAGVSVVNGTVNYDGSMSGGADNESIDQMRYSIPRAAKLRDRAITLQDFADLAMQVPGVAKATAQGAFYTNVKVYIAPVGGGRPSDNLRSAVASYLVDRALVGTTVEIHPLNVNEWMYQEIYLALDLHVLKSYGQLTVLNAVTSAITQLLAFESMSYGQFISQGDVYHAALAVPGVDYIVITQMQLAQQNGTTLIPPTVGDLQVASTLIPHLNPNPPAPAPPPNGNLAITPYGGLK